MRLTKVESSHPSRRLTIFATASILVLLFQGFLFSSTRLQEWGSAFWEQTATEVPAKMDAESGQGHCLSLDIDGGDMDHLLEKYKQVLLVMPAKAAGTTYKKFAKRCMQSAGTPAFSQIDNVVNKPMEMKNVLGTQLKLPSLVASHLNSADSFQNLIRGATKDTLIIYSHREETSRLKSAIKHVSAQRLCQTPDKYQNQVKINGTECQVNESLIIKKIEEQMNEIGVGSKRLLPCETFESIRDNAPNLAFVHYKQANRLQKLLSKYHCPGSETDIKVNVGENKQPVSIVLEGRETSGTIVPIDDWLDAKSQMLELILSVKDGISCQATVKRIEENLLACPDEALQISGWSYDNQWIVLSK